MHVYCCQGPLYKFKIKYMAVWLNPKELQKMEERRRKDEEDSRERKKARERKLRRKYSEKYLEQELKNDLTNLTNYLKGPSHLQGKDLEEKDFARRELFFKLLYYLSRDPDFKVDKNNYGKFNDMWEEWNFFVVIVVIKPIN